MRPEPPPLPPIPNIRLECSGCGVDHNVSSCRCHIWGWAFVIGFPLAYVCGIGFAIYGRLTGRL
jgi:hypothetical protein